MVFERTMEVTVAIEQYSNETQTQWDRGGFQVMIMSEASDRPIGFCDGSDADEAEIQELAEGEGAEIAIDKKLLKTGRQVWTVRTLSEL